MNEDPLDVALSVYVSVMSSVRMIGAEIVTNLKMSSVFIEECALNK